MNSDARRTGTHGAGAETGPRRCPICGRPTAAETRPFCSRRCRDVDLARWFGGAYCIAGADDPADADGDPPDGT